MRAGVEQTEMNLAHTQTTSPPVRVMIVDDSALMRKLLAKVLSHDPGIEVIDTAMDGQFALDHLARMRPDVVLMDVDMPRMDGLSALECIVAEHRLPVVMCSTRTSAGAETTVQALARGAVDFIEKPTLEQLTSGEAAERISKVVRGAAHARVHATRKPSALATPSIPRPLPEKSSAPASSAQLGLHKSFTFAEVEIIARKARALRPELIVIGTSTGGPPALEQVLAQLPANFPLGIVIVQHMPPGFTGLLASHLDRTSQIEVREAKDGDLVVPGLALVSPGDAHARVFRTGQGGYVVRLDTTTPTISGHRPSVDVLFASVAEARARAIGVVMTGMGSDGAAGMGRMAETGCLNIAQTPDSCVCHGMPKSSIDRGCVSAVVPLDWIAQTLVACAVPSPVPGN